MRQQFIQTIKRYEAKKELWWASKIVKVFGGYMGFESWTDYKVWKNQK